MQSLPGLCSEAKKINLSEGYSGGQDDTVVSEHETLENSAHIVSVVKVRWVAEVQERLV